jgi:hypothetical protein
VRSGQILLVLIRAVPPAEGADGAKALGHLGRVLGKWGSLPAVEFREMVGRLLGDQLRRQAGLLASRLQQFGGQPEYWARDVRGLLGLLDAEAVRGPDTVAWDLAEAFGPDAAHERLQRLVRRLGDLLQAWPGMMAAARALRARGVRLAVAP